MKGAIRHSLTAGMLAVLVLFATSCSDDDPVAPPPPPPAPTLTAVAPATGSALGGTTLTLTGTNLAGATVTVGGVSATSVNVVNATTITCVSPAGTGGPAVVAVTTAGGTATLAGAFAYNATPTVTSVTPPAGSSFGGTTLSIAGTGFTANGAGANTVSIGGVAATNVVVVSDVLITCTSPAGTPSGAGLLVTVTNANGSGSLADSYSYFSTILAAEGGNSLTGNLFAIDAATGVAQLVGPIGFSVTSMDFHPTTGVLFGATAGGGGVTRQLITIDPVTGAGTLVGPTNDGMGFNHRVPGCSFVGSTLFGTDASGFNFISVDHNTGLVTILGATPAAPGGGFASDATDANVFYMNSSTGPLFIVDVVAATFTAGPTLLGGGNRLNSATFHNGTLFAIDSDGQPAGNRQLVTIDTTTGVVTPVGASIAGSFMDALASPTR